MDDLHDRMEDLARRVDTAAAPDLEQARQRHTRRRRTSALTLGIALTAIVALLAFQIARTDGAPSQPAATDGPTSDTVTIWPAADTAAEPWRSSPEEVITRFSYMVLGWSTPDIVEVDGGYELRSQPCPDAARCIAPLTVTTAEVEPGVWSVRSVSNPDLAVEVGVAEPAVALTGGSRVRFDLALADDRAAHIGMVASNGCREAAAFEVGLDAGTHTLQLPEDTPEDPDCDDMGVGYLFAYVMDDTTVPTGDPLREAAAIEYPWLTVIPIYLEMEEPDATSTATGAPGLAETLTVTCGQGATSIEVDHVAAGPMGVAVELVGADEGYRILVDDRIVRAPHTILDLAPGTHEVLCIDVGQVEAFEVVDTEGYWTDPSVDCAPPGDEGEFDADRIPVDGNPDDELIAFADQILAPSLSETGTTRFGGYAASPVHRTVISVDEDGSVLGRVDFTFSGTDWFPDGFVTCEGQAVF